MAIELNTALQNKEKAIFHLTSVETGLSLNNDGTTWTKIPNMLGECLQGFTVSGGTLTKVNKGGKFLITGVSDLSVDKASTIYYAVFLNGVQLPHETTEHTFSNQSKVENISITSIVTLSENDTIEIKAKGDGVTSNVTFDVIKLDVTFWGEEIT